MPPLCPPKREYNAVSAERLTKFGNIVWVEALRYLTKITTLRRKAARSHVLVAKHTASLQLLCTAGSNLAKLDARTELKGGGEASRATGCTTNIANIYIIGSKIVALYIKAF
jgi:hypothetical protein